MDAVEYVYQARQYKQLDHKKRWGEGVCGWGGGVFASRQNEVFSTVIFTVDIGNYPYGKASGKGYQINV